MREGLRARAKHVLPPVDAWVETQRGSGRNGQLDEGSGTRTDHDGDKGRIAHHAVEDDDSTVTCTPPRKLALVKSLDLLRRVSGATRTAEENSAASSKTAQSPGHQSENRFTVIMDTAESDSESGAEEWESVLSEMGNQE